MKYFGFVDDNPIEQKDIAVELKVSRSYVSKYITKILKEIKSELERLEIVEVSTNKKYINTK